jgi:hypothetical protein
LDFTRPAQAELSAAGEYVRSRHGDDAAEQFGRRVEEIIAQTAERLAKEIASDEFSKPFQSPDESASVRWAQPVYRLSVETSPRRRRGSSAGLWYLYYALHDKANTGKPDTMLMYAFRHSAASPMTPDAGDDE